VRSRRRASACARALGVETSALGYALYKPIDSVWPEASAPFRREHER
jgi:hypothetical protein